MLGRLIIGTLIGAIIGLALGLLVVKGLGLAAVGAVFAYLFAAMAGALTGLFAGKPIWASGGKIEAGLKAFFGALVAVGAMFVLRKWVHVPLDLSSFGAGQGELGDLPVASLPLIAGVLGALFGIDNTPEAEDKDKAPASTLARARVASDVRDDEEEEESPRASKRARH